MERTAGSCAALWVARLLRLAVHVGMVSREVTWLSRIGAEWSMMSLTSAMLVLMSPTTA